MSIQPASSNASELGMVHLTYVPTFLGSFSSPKIFVDGALIGPIKNGKTLALPLSTGEHLLQAKGSMGCGSNNWQFSALAGQPQQIELLVGVSKSNFIFFKLAFINLILDYLFKKAVFFGVLTSQQASIVDPSTLLILFYFFHIFKTKHTGGKLNPRKVNLYFRMLSNSVTENSSQTKQQTLCRIISLAMFVVMMGFIFFNRQVFLSLSTKFLFSEIAFLYNAIMLGCIVKSANVIPDDSV